MGVSGGLRSHLAYCMIRSWLFHCFDDLDFTKQRLNGGRRRSGTAAMKRNAKINATQQIDRQRTTQ